MSLNLTTSPWENSPPTARNWTCSGQARPPRNGSRFSLKPGTPAIPSVPARWTRWWVSWTPGTFPPPGPSHPGNLDTVVKPAFFWSPETLKADVLFQQMKQRRTYYAVVLDDTAVCWEWSPSETVEQVVGEIQQEGELPEIQAIGRGRLADSGLGPPGRCGPNPGGRPAPGGV